MPITSEKKLKELPSIYTKIPADQTGKIEATKTFLIKLLNKYLILLKKGLTYNTTKQIIVIISKMKKINNFKIYFDFFKTILKVFFIQQLVNKSFNKKRKNSRLC